MTPNQIKLQDLQNEQKKLEEEIRKCRVRISEIRATLTGDGGNSGLTAIVEVELSKQKWIDVQPELAAMRATPEWQEWHKTFKEKYK